MVRVLQNFGGKWLLIVNNLMKNLKDHLPCCLALFVDILNIFKQTRIIQFLLFRLYFIFVFLDQTILFIKYPKRNLFPRWQFPLLLLLLADMLNPLLGEPPLILLGGLQVIHGSSLLSLLLHKGVAVDHWINKSTAIKLLAPFLLAVAELTRVHQSHLDLWLIDSPALLLL